MGTDVNGVVGCSSIVAFVLELFASSSTHFLADDVRTVRVHYFPLSTSTTTVYCALSIFPPGKRENGRTVAASTHWCTFCLPSRLDKVSLLPSVDRLPMVRSNVTVVVGTINCGTASVHSLVHIYTLVQCHNEVQRDSTTVHSPSSR